MKCCGSQIISIAPESSHARDVAADFDALLWHEAFAPLAKAMGFYGDTVVGIAARKIAQSERGGMTDRLQSAIESVARAGTDDAGKAR